MRLRATMLALACLAGLAWGQQGGTASSSLNVQSTVQVMPAQPKYLLEVMPVAAPPPTPGDERQPGEPCPFLAPPDPSAKPGVDLQSLVQMLGSPIPFSFQPKGKDKLLVYSSRWLTPEDRTRLKDIKATAGQLVQEGLAKKKDGYEVVLTLPHASAFADPAAAITALGYQDFTVQDVGKGKVRVKADSADCDTLKSFYKDVRDLVWTPYPQSPVYRVFFMNAPDAATAMGGGSGGGGGGGSSSSSGSGGASPTPTASSAAGTTPASGSAAAAPAAATPASSGSASGTTVAMTVAPAAGGAAASAGGASGGGAGSGGGSGGGGGGGGGSSSASGSMSPLGNDFVVFGEPQPGDDAAVLERKRIIAALDLPRPQMIINVWSAQTSSTRVEDIKSEKERLRRLVDSFNDGLQLAIDRGWEYLKHQIDTDPQYFDGPFRQYIASPEVAGGGLITKADPDKIQNLAEQYLRFEPAAPVHPSLITDYDLCPTDHYCLGYKGLFTPLKPRLTDLLLTNIAAAHPWEQANAALNAMESRRPHGNAGSCDQKDRDGYEKWGNELPPTPKEGELPLPLLPPGVPPFMLECFREAAYQAFHGDGTAPPRTRLLRAAMADFLFHYKVSQQYPHELSPYNLSQSAQNFNSTLTPLIDAFNRDLKNLQAEIINDITTGVELKQAGIVGSDRPAFKSNGFITVLTISGSEAKVNTTSQSFLDATRQPMVSELVKSITSTTTPTSASAAAGTLLQNISPIQAQVIMGTMAAMQSSKVQIGRGLNIDVTPRSLSGAAAAEIQVSINADESASPTYFGGSLDGKNADISRVAQHDTSTRVRVESIKLFEVSTMTAELQKSRVRFPIVPPFVQIPYLGSLIGIPLPVAKEFHTSTAVLSAVVVPTAADLAYGISFNFDRLVTGDKCEPGLEKDGSPKCKTKMARSFSDLHGIPARGFHERMVECFATGTWKDKGKPKDCSDLTVQSIVEGTR